MEINGNDISDKVMEFDKMVAELRDWLVLLDRTLRTQPVTVGDLEEIEETIARQKVCFFFQTSSNYRLLRP